MRDSIQAAVTKQITTTNKDVKPLTHEESKWLTGGIALPSLCLRYLLHQDAFPLGRTFTLSGLYRSNKTSFAFEIMKWVLRHGGLGWYNDVEKKDSPDMREALLDYDPGLIPYVQVIPCSTQQQWQGSVSSQFDAVIAQSKKHKNQFRVLGCSIVDSVAAAGPKSSAEDFMTKHGGAGRRSHPEVALYNAKWMEDIVHFVSAGPFVLLLIQHSTEVQDPARPGITTRKQKGGTEMAFAKTTAFEMTRTRDLKETNTAGGVDIQIECTKNALGPAKRRIIVPARWVWVPMPGTNKRRQEYFWDWHHATIDLLLKFQTMDGRKATWKGITDVCDLHKASGGRVWSRKLGIPESSPVKFSEAGELLEYENTALLPGLYDVLHITQRSILTPGADLRDIWSGKVPILETPSVVPYPRRRPTAEEEDGDDD